MMNFFQLKADIAIEVVRQIHAVIEVPAALAGDCSACATLDILGGAYVAGLVEHARAKGESFEDFQARITAEFTTHLTEVINEARNYEAGNPEPTHPGTGTPQ